MTLSSSSKSDVPEIETTFSCSLDPEQVVQILPRLPRADFFNFVHLFLNQPWNFDPGLARRLHFTIDTPNDLYRCLLDAILNEWGVYDGKFSCSTTIVEQDIPCLNRDISNVDSPGDLDEFLKKKLRALCCSGTLMPANCICMNLQTNHGLLTREPYYVQK